jgi:outer membrane lipoprotein-sorting protein
MKRRGGIIIAAIAGIAMTCAALAAPPGSGVRSRLADTAVLRGDFVQEKQLQGFHNPLRSSGEFLLARGHGMVWDTRTPFASRVVMSARGLRVIESDGSVRVIAGDADASVASTANALMMALLTGDTAALSAQFAIEETLLADGGWTLGLVPRPGVMSTLYRRIDLQGDRFVRRVALEDSNGDRTDIRFVELRDAPAELSAEEAKRFD